MKRFLSLLMVSCMLLQCSPLCLAGGDLSIFQIQAGKVKHTGKGGPANGQVVVLPPVNNGKGGQGQQVQIGGPAQPGQQTQVGGTVVNQQQAQISVIPVAPSQFTGYQFQYVQNGLRRYRRNRRRGTIIIYPIGNNPRRHMTETEYKYWLEMQRMKHEKEMLEMQMRYRERQESRQYAIYERERARREREIARQQRAQTQMAMLSLGFGTIFTLISMQQARRAERDAGRRYKYYDNYYRQSGGGYKYQR